MIGEDAEKTIMAVGAVVVAGVIYGVAKMVPSTAVGVEPPRPSVTASITNYHPTVYVPWTATYVHSPSNTIVWRPDPQEAAARTTVRVTSAPAPSASTTPIFLPPTMIDVPTPAIDPHSPSFTPSSPPAVSRAAWYHIAPDSSLWVTSVTLRRRGAQVGDHPVLGPLSQVKGVWLYDVTLYNSGSGPVLVVPARLHFGDSSEETMFPWNGAWCDSADSGADTVSAGACCPGAASPVFTLAPSTYSTVSVYAENAGAVPSRGDSNIQPASWSMGDSARGAVRPRQPQSMVFYIIDSREADSAASGWKPQSAARTHVDLVRRLEKDGEYEKIELPIPVDSAPSFPV